MWKAPRRIGTGVTVGSGKARTRQSGRRVKAAPCAGKSPLAGFKHVEKARRNHSQADSSRATWLRNSPTHTK